MERDVSDLIGQAVGMAAREGVQNISRRMRKRSSVLSSPGKLAAGAGMMALAPLAGKGVGKLVGKLAGNGAGPLKEAGEKIGGAGEKLGGAGEKLSGALGQGKSDGLPGVGKGRRMPVQQDIDIGAPLKVVYNQWTQFEEWPKFMHRLQQVSQEDESHVSFKTKIWGFSREFKAEIVEQRPDERIKWKVTEGVTHTGVVTFHELGPRLTRVELNIDVQPGSLIEKAARGMRHVKRAVRADLARFKAYVLMQEEESGAWRGEIEDGDVKKSTSRGGSSSSSGRSSGRAKASARSRSRSSRGSRSSSNGTKASSSNGSSGSTSGSRKKSGSRS